MKETLNKEKNTVKEKYIGAMGILIQEILLMTK